MYHMEQKLTKVTEAVSAAGETCLTIVAGQIAGIGAKWIDKWFLTEEDGSHFAHHENGDGEDSDMPSLGRRKAKQLAKKLSKNVSTPNELII